MSVVINVSNLSKQFGRIKALKGISFEVREGDVFGYLGPNGAGKTTTLRHILGLLVPDSGEVKILGYNSLELLDEIKKEIGVVMESNGLYPGMTVHKNLLYYGEIYGVSKHDLPTRIDEVLKFLELEGRSDDKISSLSKGMKRKVALGRALLVNPKILVFDELTAGLDPHYQQKIRNLVTDLAEKKKTTIIFSSHNLHEVQDICNRLGVLNNGKLVALGEKSEITKKISDEVRFECLLPNEEKASKAIEIVESLSFVKSSSINASGNKIEFALFDPDKVNDLIKEFHNNEVRISEIKRQNIGLKEAYFDIVGE